MKKLTIMIATAVMVFGFTMGTVYAQCCSMQQKKADANNKSAAIQCSMKQNMSKSNMQKMMKNCPMMKNMSDADKKKMMANCPMMKSKSGTSSTSRCPWYKRWLGMHNDKCTCNK